MLRVASGRPTAAPRTPSVSGGPTASWRVPAGCPQRPWRSSWGVPSQPSVMASMPLTGGGWRAWRGSRIVRRRSRPCWRPPHGTVSSLACLHRHASMAGRRGCGPWPWRRRWARPRASRSAWEVMQPFGELSSGFNRMGSGRHTGSRVLSHTTCEKKGAGSPACAGVGASGLGLGLSGCGGGSRSAQPHRPPWPAAQPRRVLPHEPDRHAPEPKAVACSGW